ncbi:MAG: 6-bladed beta-propeller [Deltaproteobacteria bacterium]|nr:6-bladed beta-propeller [Deltaproteobacteria bacterium]MCL5276273.1 6-bladed beta-propeller [Deltaproteobacteria bacterium]
MIKLRGLEQAPTRISFLGIGVFIISILSTCAHAPHVKAVNIVWPENNPRIYYVRSVYSANDLGIKPGWFSRIFNFIAGENSRYSTRFPPFAIAAYKGVIGVTDIQASNVILFDKGNNSFAVISKCGASYFTAPTGIAITGKRIYVADSSQKTIFIISSRGRCIGNINNGSFIRPTSVAVAQNGDVYIVDTGMNRVFVYDDKGKPKFSFGSHGDRAGEFNFPTAIAIKNNTVFIIDSLNFRIQTFSLSGKFISSFGRQGDGSGDFARPKSIAVDSDGIIYITDALFDVVQMFNGKGDYLMTFGRHGTDDGELSMPAGIAVEHSYIYVADGLNNRIDIFKRIGDTKNEALHQ